MTIWASVALISLIIFQAVILIKVRRRRSKDVYGEELNGLRRWLTAYYISFLNVDNPPTDPVGGSTPDSESYRQMLAQNAYPSDLIAYAQHELYETWPYQVQMKWDGWLFANLAEIEPYIKGMVVDYQSDTAVMTDDQIIRINIELEPKLQHFAKQTFGTEIDSHNAFALKYATDFYAAYNKATGA